MKRTISSLLAALASVAVAVAPAAMAADYSLANGAVQFSAPDAWPMLMEKLEGTDEFVALQVKTPHNAGALARITVAVQRVDGLQGFQRFLNAGTARARKLTGYAAVDAPGTTSSLRYTAIENHQKNAYSEHYAYRANLGIQVRCIRPARAPADWVATFDAGCKAIVTAVEK